MGPTPLFALALLSVDLPLAYSHGAIVFPPSRNAVEGQLDPWAKGVPYVQLLVLQVRTWARPPPFLCPQ